MVAMVIGELKSVSRQDVSGNWPLNLIRSRVWYLGRQKSLYRSLWYPLKYLTMKLGIIHIILHCLNYCRTKENYLRILYSFRRL